MIQPNHTLSIRVQCALLNVHRSRIYYQPKSAVEDTELINRLAELYSQYPMYGYRRLTHILKQEGYEVNAKRVLRFMHVLGVQAIYPGPRTTLRDKASYRHPYLLTNVSIVRPHQVWHVDITYIRTDKGFVYLTAFIDRWSRVIVGYNLSNTLDTESCIRALENAMWQYGTPEIINSDQGCQFTSQLWNSTLQQKNIRISMCGRGRSNDNAHIERLWRTLKYEALYLFGCRDPREIKRCLPAFIVWYNEQRPHQALGYKTPLAMLKEASMQSEGKGIIHLPLDHSMIDQMMDHY